MMPRWVQRSRARQFCRPTKRRSSSPSATAFGIAQAPRLATACTCSPASHRQLEDHRAAFLNAYKFAKRLKTLRGLTSYEAICKAGADEPDRFKYDPTHLTPGLNT